VAELSLRYMMRYSQPNYITAKINSKRKNNYCESSIEKSVQNVIKRTLNIFNAYNLFLNVTFDTLEDILRSPLNILSQCLDIIA